MKSNQYGRTSRFLRLFDHSSLCSVEPEAVDPDETAGATDPADPKTAPEPAAAPPEDDPPAEEAPKPEEPKRKAWWQDRIDQLTREKYELRQEADRARQERETLQALLGAPKANAAPEPPKAPEQPRIAQGELERRAEAIADAKLAAMRFQERADAVRSDGLKEHGAKFDEALSALLQAGVELGPSAFVQAALDTEAPAKVLYALGADPEKAMELARMSPTKMAIEMDRMARELSAPASRAVSAAPPPSPELRRAAVQKAVDLYDNKTDSAEWLAERERQIAAKRKADARVQ